MNKKYKILQQGRGMIEMLGVLAVVGVLSVGGIYGYSSATQKAKLNRMRSNITHIVSQVKQYYLNQGSYDGLTTQMAIKLGIIPDDMTIEDASTEEGKSAINIYNGEFLIEATIDPLDKKPMFMVILTNLPKKEAIELGTSNWADDADLEMIELQNNSDISEGE